MLNKIIRFSLENRHLVLILAVLLIIGGMYTTATMEVDVFPDLNAPTVVVMTEAEGMAPEEVERLVTFPVETAVNGATGVRRVRSSSTTGFSIVNIEFDWGTEIYKARQIVSEKLAMIGDDLPEGAGQPTLGPQSSILGEILIIGLTADSTSLQDLRTIADWNIRPRLLSTGGIAQVAVIGGDIKEYQIQIETGRMRKHGVSIDEVIDAVKGMNTNASGGTLYQYGNEYIVRGVLSTNEIEELGKAVVKKNGGVPVLVSDVAKVKVGPKTPRLGFASNDGKPAVLLTVTKQPDVSTLKLTSEIEKSLDDISATLPTDVKMDTKIFRQSDFIQSSIDNVRKSLLEGGFFVIIVLFLFLMNWRTTVISLVSIPVSILVALVSIKLMGLTINTMSLGGIAIAIGSLVDDSIVDVENVFKRLKQNRMKPEGERRTVLETVFEASKEVRMPMLNSTLIIVASFLPLFFLSGMEGRMLKPLGITFVIALFASTFVALTLTPVLSSYLLKNEGDEGKEPWLTTKLAAIYGKALKKAIEWKKTILAMTGALLIAAIIIFFNLGRSFLPAFNEGSFTIAMSSLPGISVEESEILGRQAEEILLSIPEIQTVGRKTGRAELDEHSFGVNTSEFECPYVLGGKSRARLTAEVRERLNVIPGVNIEIGGPIAHRIDEMLSGTKANIAIKLFGTDLNKMYSLGNAIKDAISDVPGITDINVEQQVERPQLNIVPRREVLARYGIPLPEFAEAVSVMLEGMPVSQVYEGNRSFDLTLKIADDGRRNIDFIKDIDLDAADGTKVPLSSVADVISSAGPNTINRENVSRKLVISANVTGGELSKAVSAIREEIDGHIELPQDYHIEYGGQFESEERASKTIALISLFSLIIIYMLLFGEFRNTTQTLTVLLNLPLALIGGVLAIWCTGGIMSIPAIIGFISLFGIATRNGMLLVDRYNALRDEGLSLMDAVTKGSLDRLNPILMTAITSGLALLPLALGGDLPGNEIQSPMAKVILGGLLSSTILNGFIVPIMYLITNRKREK
ncbi:MAG: CusA/CzcA family heavy metal efflux RND transporter [Bacteroidales bacterium]|nr:CusA/CzcA family heavy metal efflux RND transporter [Bacteroidales bacterium]